MIPHMGAESTGRAPRPLVEGLVRGRAAGPAPHRLCSELVASPVVHRPGDVAMAPAGQRDGGGGLGGRRRQLRAPLSVSVVLPCLDEAASVGQCVERARRASPRLVRTAR